MKKIIILISILAIALIFIFINNNREKEYEISKVDEIVINETDIIEEISFDSMEVYNAELNDTYKITNEGVYNLTGSIENGQIYIDTKGYVKLILDNVNINNNNGPAIMISNSKTTYIELKGENYLSDSDTYELDENNEPDGCLFSKDNLVIMGSGKLVIDANYLDGIVVKDNLKIIDGIYEINANDDGIRAKDSLIIENGEFIINTKGDGIKSTNDNDTNLGYINIYNGTFKINSNKDGIQAETDILIKDGNFDVKTDSETETINYLSNYNEESIKAIKAVNNIVIENGNFSIESEDDSIHSNKYLGIKNGTFTINSSDDGIHADSEIIIDGGIINIKKSYEGIEAESITINGGDISVTSTDDGLNANGGNDLSSFNRRGANKFNDSGNSKITINNTNMYINASGDGIDANGNIYINGGTIIINGPTNSGNSALDYDKEFCITSGLFIASGSSGMAQNASSSSTQNTVMINFDNTIEENDIISIKNNVNEILTYKSSKDFQSVVISSPNLEKNETYEIYINVDTLANEENGLYELGGIVSETLYETFKINSVITNVGNSFNQFGNHGNMYKPRR